MRKWQCLVCSFVYEEALGYPMMASLPGRVGMISPTIGCAQNVASGRKISTWSNYRYGRITGMIELSKRGAIPANAIN